jgi:peroxiredoxin
VTILLGISAFASLSNDTGSPIGRKIEPFRLQDYRGVWQSLDDAKDSRLVVVAFLGTQCPLAQQYAPRLVELAGDFGPKGVAFFGVMSNQQDTLKDIEGYVQAHQIPFPVLKDLGNEVADRFAAQRTPEVFVLDAERKVRYWGRIDDQYGIGYKRPKPTQRYLATALEELLAGKPVGQPVVESVGCFIGRTTKRTATGSVTYTKDIAPILRKRCVGCHQAGDIAPFALTTYRHAAAWADTIQEVVQSGRMPPWHADPNHGRFANDPRLSDEEKKLIEQWVQNGLPKGEGADEPLVQRAEGAWRIGKPDFVIQLPKPFKVPATGVVDYQYYIIDPGFKEDRWVKASEVRPGSRAVVHHAVVFVQPPGAGSVVEKEGFGFEMLAGYGPGTPPRVLKNGLAKFIPAGSRLVFQMHYTPCGVETLDQTEVGLIFADPKEVKREHRTGLALNLRLRIPPGVKDYSLEATHVFRQDFYLLSMAPHMHLRGKSFRFEAHYPNGSKEILLDVPCWDFEWQHLYDLAEPKLMPEGTRLVCTAHYDNSEANLSNPDPKATVTFGLQTWQEMMVGFFLMALADQDLTLGEPQVKPLGNGDYEATFKYRPPQPAKAVYLAGTFNDWKPDAHKMDGPDASGAFTTRLKLKQGTHEYKFVIDGKTWKHDPGNRRQAGFYNNSLLVIGAEPASQ